MLPSWAHLAWAVLLRIYIYTHNLMYYVYIYNIQIRTYNNVYIYIQIGPDCQKSFARLTLNANVLQVFVRTDGESAVLEV